MGKSIKFITVSVLFALLMGTGLCFGDTGETAERSIAVNELPNITLYIDTDQTNNIKKENLQVYVDDEQADLQWIGSFEETGDGVIYSFLVDVSESVGNPDFKDIKRKIITFSNSLSDKDRICIVPYGESVYSDQTLYQPGTKAFSDAVEGLTQKDAFSQLYAAMDGTAELPANNQEENQQRRVAIAFTGCLDETDSGLITRDEAVRKMGEAGIPLYVFALGNDDKAKASLRALAQSTGGRIYDLSQIDSVQAFTRFRKMINETFTLKVKAKNTENILDTFSIKVMKDGEIFLLKEKVRARKAGERSVTFTDFAKKCMLSYWWLFVTIAGVGTVLIIFMLKKRKKETVAVDGKVVYSSKIQRKYYMQAEAHHTKNITMIVSINGSSPFEQPVNIVGRIIAGRSDSCDVYFDDISISGQHFSIEQIDGELYLQDLGSMNGTYLNDVKISGKQRILDGDTIDAGRASVKIKL